MDTDMLIKRWKVIRAWFVHFYTSLGILAGFMALIAITQENAQHVFAWLGLALFIDSTDGTIARAWEVKKWASELDGRKLDDITDYINFTFLPVFFAYHFRLVEGFGGIALASVLLSSAFGFCRISAKTDDGYFTGFPSFWNLLVFYLYIFQFNSTVNALILLIFSGLVFLPMKFLSFSTPRMERLTKITAVIYGGLLFVIVMNLNQNPLWLTVFSLVFPTVYLLFPLLRSQAAESPEGKEHDLVER